jgi:radical SAM/Cys-rich protein
MEHMHVERQSSFQQMLDKHEIELSRAKTNTLQVNVGLLCNLNCRHCHLNAGPNRKEIMGPETLDQVVAYAKRCQFDKIDITGGAPELNPHIDKIIEELAWQTKKIILRSNLVALDDRNRDHLLSICREYKVVIVASFPSLSKTQAEAQRGNGIFENSVKILQKLNSIGYGQDNSGLELNLVSNPTGAFLPPAQEEIERRFKQVLSNKWQIVFNNLYSFTNVPLGRYRQWLLHSGNFDAYLDKLISNFNSDAVLGLMCRSLVTVDWQGFLYDCDFNLAKSLPLGRKKIHVSNMDSPPRENSKIAVEDHCFACTAGTGFT